MPTALRAPKNPEVLVGTIAAMRLLSGERQPGTPLERQMLDELRKLQLKPEVARRIVAAFDAKPDADRRRLLGRFADRSHTLKGMTPASSPGSDVRDHRRGASSAGTAGSTSTSRTVPATDNVGPLGETLTIDGRPGGIRYTVRYLGLWCQKETAGLGSDEIYVITSGLAINKGVNASVRALSHPMGTQQDYYGDVDSGERRLGPVAVVYTGSPDTLSLVVTVMEHDYGDPDHYREQVQTFVDGAIALASYLYPAAGAVLAYFKDNIVDAINWILGTGDDLISSEVATWERDALEALAILTPGEYQGTTQALVTTSPPTSGPVVNVPTGLFAHFVTRHRGDGADYIVGFDIDRDPPRPPPIFL